MFHNNPVRFLSPAASWLLAVTTLLVASSASMEAAESGKAAEKSTATQSAESAIRAAVDSYVAAFNRGDAKVVAEHWSESGIWVGPDGQRAQGRSAIQKELEAFFTANKGVEIDEIATTIRPVSPDVTVEEGSVRITRPNGPPERSAYIAIHVKKDGKWQLDSVRELESSDPVPLHENLKQLEWMVGDWIDASEDSTVETSVTWSKNKAFLTANFRVSSPGAEHLEGTQMIGWDPSIGGIHSWMFDSDGGFGEGLWTCKDNRWIVKFNQVLADGRKASATNIYTLIDGGHYSWQSIGRQVDGQFQPNIDPVTVVRRSAHVEPKSGAKKEKEKK